MVDRIAGTELSRISLAFDEEYTSLSYVEELADQIHGHLNYKLKSVAHFRKDEFGNLQVKVSDLGYRITLDFPAYFGEGEYRERAIRFIREFFADLLETTIEGSLIRRDTTQLIEGTDRFTESLNSNYTVKIVQENGKVARDEEGNKVKFKVLGSELQEAVSKPTVEPTETDTYAELAEGYRVAVEALVKTSTDAINEAVTIHQRQMAIILERLARSERENKHLRKLSKLPKIAS